MAQTTLVEMQMSEAQRLIDRLNRDGVDVIAAAWVKEEESGDWYLYLATPLVTEDKGTPPAYRRLNSLVRAMQEEGFGLDPFEIKMIGPHNPTAQAIVANRGPRACGPPRRFAGARLGELAVEQAWIYPTRPASTEARGKTPASHG